MSHKTGSDQSKNVCLTIFHEDDYYNGGNCLSRELSWRVLTGTNQRSSASTSDGASKNFMYATQVHLFATVLEDILMQFRILDDSINEMHLYKMQCVMNELLEKKFGLESFEHEDELLAIDPKNLESDAYKLRKHAADRNTCITVFTNTYLELIQDGTYEALIKYKQDVENQLDHYLFLIDEVARNKEMRRNLRRQVRQQRVRIKSSVYETNQTVEELVSRLGDEAVHRNTQERYIEKWESARTEQNNMRIHDTESSFSNTITKYNSKVDDEQRVHSEVENIVNVTVGKTLKKIEDCMSKYDKDMEALEIKITIMRLNYEKEVEKRLELEQKFVEHEVELKNFMQFKEDRERLCAYQMKMNTAAISVQAWWRGLLVRLKLGPFKPSLHKKTNTKKKKK